MIDAAGPTVPADWFHEGLRFDCGRCGNCCSGPSGVVLFGPEELAAMAAHLGLLPFQFLERYARDAQGRPALREVERADGSFDCIFLARESERGSAVCTIHEVRPTQCRTWPFWPQNLASRDAYTRTGRTCAGVRAGLGGTGSLHDEAEIRRQRDATPRL